MHSTRHKVGQAFSVVALALLLGACSPRQLIVGSLADELAGQGQGSENDLELLRDAAPFHLKLSEAILARQPGHQALAESVAAGFTQYAYAFVAFEAERIEARDAKAAERLRQRAAKLYARAHLHAMRALELAEPGFANGGDVVRPLRTRLQGQPWPDGTVPDGKDRKQDPTPMTLKVELKPGELADMFISIANGSAGEHELQAWIIQHLKDFSD